DDLIQRHNTEIHSHEFDDGMESRHGCADCQTSESGFRNRSIHPPLRAEFFHKTFADLKGALVVAHFLADQKNTRVSTHLLPHGLVQSFPIGDHHVTTGRLLKQPSSGVLRSKQSSTYPIGKELLWQLGVG